ncbi:MAG: hypothetical protein N3D85_04930 [Candidatus Bathyarchaeota archaeon]|nr:hypothetical protein [Candidatus Bathyarchaeota archaeon]
MRRYSCKSLFLLVLRVFKSKKALALPATFLILFVSTLGLISVTYYFAVEKVNARSQSLKVSTAKQDFLAVDDCVLAVAWQPGSVRTLELGDSGGKLCVEPSRGTLFIRVTGGQDINQTVFAQTVGYVVYQLPYSESPDTGLYLKGDSRSIVNQSGSLLSQVSIQHGVEHPELLLRYRPLVSSIASGAGGSLPVNVVRIYVVNLNSSENIALYGRIPLKISCYSNKIITTTYTVSYKLTCLTVNSFLDESSGQVTVPISSSEGGAVINVEVVESNVKIERCLR